MKTIYLEPDDEIVSVIDKLIKADDDQVSLVVPIGSQIWQNSINLKLLKREADYLGKKLILFVPDEFKAEAAEKAGFEVKREKNISTELIEEKEEEKIEEPKQERAKDDMIGILVEEMKSERKNPLIQDSVPDQRARSIPVQKESRKQMMDIVRPESSIKPKSKPLSWTKSLKKVVPFRTSAEILKKDISQISAEPEPIYPSGFVRKKVRVWPKLLTGLIVIAFLMVGLIGYLVLPTTEILIYPKKEKMSFDLNLIGDLNISSIDEALNKVPLQEIRVTKTLSRTFPSTGEKEVKEKAKGVITIYNEYSSSVQTLVGTTRFQSPEGKIFRISRNVVVPGAKIEQGKIVASTIQVEVTADQPGADYNIGPSDFTIPGFKDTAKYAGFYAKSDKPMEQGYIGLLKIVSEDDLSQARESLIEELKNQAKETLESQIPTDLELVQGGIREQIEEISEIEPGGQMEHFTLEMEITSQALLFNQEDLKVLVDLNLAAQVSENKIPVSQSQLVRHQEIRVDWQNQEVDFNLEVEEDVVFQIDTAKIKRDLAGQNEIEVRKYLANQMEIERAKVSFWPFWVKRIPMQEKKIEVEISLD